MDKYWRWETEMSQDFPGEKGQKSQIAGKYQ